MTSLPSKESAKQVVAFGPEMLGFGSWEWVGADIAEALSNTFETRLFRDEVPACDVVVFVKFKPPVEVLAEISRRTSVVYCPIDFYGSAAEIDADHRSLAYCDRIIVHSERLRKYFSTYTQVEYIDHHLKYHTPLREIFREEGPLLWIGVRTNLPPLVEWVNQHRLPGELWVLTNPADETDEIKPVNFGFNPVNTIRLSAWTPAQHREWTKLARATIDIKENDFRGRHKPPTKAMDFLASGVPLAMNQESSSVQHLDQLGFSIASVNNFEHWLSRKYWEETIIIGRKLQTELSLEQVGRRWVKLLKKMIAPRTERIL